ncbi:hypothetical protein [Intestinimonas sp.]|uniref:hypothetical protein n=1 Tax=Intestinimonas sp. TaxID=1965293 RepID=UPI002620CC2E|nr:hypothetical protein [Intestinimonas sp.]
MKRQSYISISMDEDMKKKLRYVAEREQRTLSGQVRHLVRLYLREHENLYGSIHIEKETFTSR